jgi:hypothetical protein
VCLPFPGVEGRVAQTDFTFVAAEFWPIGMVKSHSLKIKMRYRPILEADFLNPWPRNIWATRPETPGYSQKVPAGLQIRSPVC